ncbi:MAG: HDOD domain-containing protein [Planctomycetaceae bacterium]|nr:HDOD domain-containing protein [Planctomycetaceae bacterium]
MATNSLSLADCLDEALELRPFPAAASQLITACDREDATARQLSEIIKHDPALSLKLLQIANSPIYGFAGEIRSVDHATVVLGMRALRDLAISTAVSDAFASGDGESATARRQLWVHSLSCGAIARTLSSTLNMAAPDEAFLAGIVHDVGKLFFFDHEPHQYMQATSNGPHTNIVDIETDAFGIAHTSVGQRCGQNWGLPDEINDVICFHHAPDEADFGGDLIDVVSAANRLSHLWLATVDDIAATTEILQSSGIELNSAEIDVLQENAMEEVEKICEAYAQ